MAERRPALRVAVLLGLALLAGDGRADTRGDDAAVQEAAQLSVLAPAATRQGLRLQVRAANGRAVHFDSVHPQDDAHAAEYVDFRLNGVTRDGRFFVVSALAYESGSLFWVSRATGQKTEVHTPPEVSPDGRYAVTALHEESSGPSGVFVWEIVDNELMPRGRIGEREYGLFTFKRWVANDKAELSLYSHQYLQACRGSQATTADMLLAPGVHGWDVWLRRGTSSVHCE